jgi:hypothetical protein
MLCICRTCSCSPAQQTQPGPSAVAALLLPLPLQDFLVQYSRVLCDQFAPAVPDAQLRSFVNDVFDEGGQAAPADVVLEFKHVCRCAQPAAADC